MKSLVLVLVGIGALLGGAIGVGARQAPAAEPSHFAAVNPAMFDRLPDVAQPTPTPPAPASEAPTAVAASPVKVAVVTARVPTPAPTSLPAPPVPHQPLVVETPAPSPTPQAAPISGSAPPPCTDKTYGYCAFTPPRQGVLLGHPTMYYCPVGYLGPTPDRGCPQALPELYAPASSYAFALWTDDAGSGRWYKVSGEGWFPASAVSLT